jgi:hypothetical protein
MKCNVGGIEKPIRIGVGLLAIGIGLLAGLSTAMTGVALAVGVILLITGVVGFCPLSTLFGINTCAATSDPKK